MTEQRSLAVDSNPFTSRCVRPDAMRYLFPAGLEAAELLEKLRSYGWHGQIVGPHGSGKSTLLRTLLSALSDVGRTGVLYVPRDGKRRPSGPPSRIWTSRTQVAVDGYEQLSPWSRAVFRGKCRWHRAGLLVTTHRDLGLPTLATLEVTLESFQRVVAHLLRDSSVDLRRNELQGCFMRHAPNMREMLFALHDLVERRSRETGSSQ